jgi:hypothetical protein
LERTYESIPRGADRRLKPLRPSRCIPLAMRRLDVYASDDLSVVRDLKIEGASLTMCRDPRSRKCRDRFRLPLDQRTTQLVRTGRRAIRLEIPLQRVD